jgi:hypothetical protein
MKIAFCGDSYCEYVTNGSWLFLVAKEYNADIIANGIGGRHLFHAYEVLLDVIDEADYIIFCISEPYRMPNNHRIHITPEHYSTDIEHLKGKLKTFHRLYYNDFISFKWHEVAQKGLLMQIDELMLQKKKKCIWLPCFDESMQGFIPKSGPIGNTAIGTMLYKINSVADQYSRVIYGRVVDTRKNHMDVRDNRNMARLIIDVIRSNNFTPREIDMNDYFKGSK